MKNFNKNIACEYNSKPSKREFELVRRADGSQTYKELKKYKIKGKEIMAFSKKDAIRRYNNPDNYHRCYSLFDLIKKIFKL